MPENAPLTSRASWVESYQAILAPKLPRGSGAWSIAELNLSDRNYQDLVQAFSSLGELDWEILCYGESVRREQAGLLLVVVLSEHARRHTRGDQIWSCMQTLPMRNCLRSKFFQSSGQPRRELRQTIEAAAYRWNLRHVFDIPGHMAWFLTLFLQFGFSLPAAERRLPLWLSGQLPVAVTYLLGNRMQSPAFVLMWQSLRAYRLSHITEIKCRSVLERSPWIKDEWVPKLLTLATSRLDLMERDENQEGEETEPLILGEPRLVWNPGEEPFYRCDVLAAATFELKEACYEIRSRVFDPMRILRQDEDSYHIHGESWVDIPLGKASAQCTLVAISAEAGEDDLATQSVRLWDPNYPITLYRKKNGSRMSDPEKPVRLNEGCFAVFYQCFTISPASQRAFQHGNWWVVELPPCAEADLALSQDGERIWWPAESGAQIDRDTFPISIKPRHGALIEWGAPDVAPSIEFIINIPDETELRWLRLGNEVVDFENDGQQQYRSSPFEILPKHVVHPFYATVGIQAQGRSHRVTQRVPLNCRGCYMETEGNLEVYAPSRALNIRNARRFLFHIISPQQALGETPLRNWILEGGRIVRSVPNRAVQLTQLAGYGAPLELYRGLYNAEEKIAELTTRVIDNGAVRNLSFDENGFTLKTCSPIELDEKHELIAWTIDHQFIRIPAANLKPQEYKDSWFCDLSPWQNEEGKNPGIKAVGFFYDGHRLGNWFDRKYYHAITRIAEGESEKAARCAEMLRWFKAPILDAEVASSMLFLLKRFPGDVIPVWLRPLPSPEIGLAELPLDDQWLQVVSQLCRQMGVGHLTLADASAIVEEVLPDFDTENLIDSLPKALVALDGISANLIAKIAHLYLTEISQGSLSGSATQAKTAILSRFNVGDSELEGFCDKLGIDIYFLNGLVNKLVNDARNLSEMDQHNCDLLLNHRIIRRLLTHRYLTRL